MEWDWPTLAAIVAVGALQWRALGARIDDVGRRVDTLGNRVATLANRVDGLGNDLRALDRRVARLEGWLERDRADRGPGPAAP